MRGDLRFEGWLTLGVGAVFTVTAAALLALVAACVSESACLPQADGFDFSGVFALLIAGIAAIVAGAWVLRGPVRTPTRFP